MVPRPPPVASFSLCGLRLFVIFAGVNNVPRLDALLRNDILSISPYTMFVSGSRLDMEFILTDMDLSERVFDLSEQTREFVK